MPGRTQGFPRQILNLPLGIVKAGLLCLILLFMAGSARAQVSTASVNGVVRDPKGSVIPGATITLINVATAVEHPTVSNSSGDYVILNVTPGRYTMSATAAGFNPQKTAEF